MNLNIEEMRPTSFPDEIKVKYDDDQFLKIWNIDVTISEEYFIFQTRFTKKLHWNVVDSSRLID